MSEQSGVFESYLSDARVQWVLAQADEIQSRFVRSAMFRLSFVIVYVQFSSEISIVRLVGEVVLRLMTLPKKKHYELLSVQFSIYQLSYKIGRLKFTIERFALR